MLGNKPKVQLRITVADVAQTLLRQMRRANPDDVVNDAHAIRILLRRGLDQIESKHVPTAATIREQLPRGGRVKDVKLLQSDRDRLYSYYAANTDQVDGLAGAARHAIWLAMATTPTSHSTKRKTKIRASSNLAGG